jgi:hypothetical protein
MKNNFKPIKSYTYTVMVAIGTLLSLQSFAQRHSEKRGGGNDHQRSYSPASNGGGGNSNRMFSQNRGSNHQQSRPSITPAISNRPPRSYNNTSRPNRTIVRNNDVTINRTREVNRYGNYNYGRPNYNRPNYSRPNYSRRPAGFANYHPVYNAHNPSWRYNSFYFPRRNTYVSSFPYGYTTISFGGLGYRYYNGIYYRPYQSSFIVCAPPVGLFINVLPFGYRRIYVNDYPYYYYNGTYYNQTQDNNYEVVQPPLGAVVESIPEGYETLTIDGETYYQVDGVQYKPVVQDNGEIWYEVIKVN